MTQVFDPEGQVVPVTLLEVGPCAVLQVKTVENDGYRAYQIGFDTVRKRVRRPQERFFEKIQVAPKRFVCEVPHVSPNDVEKYREYLTRTREEKDRADAGGKEPAGPEGKKEKESAKPAAEKGAEPEGKEAPAVKVGDEVSVLAFEGVEAVDVTGTTKGRGFAGTIRRHHFQSGPKAHGSKNIRELGSVGMHTDPGRILKGKRMPGRMGGVTRTVKRLRVVGVEPDSHLLLVKGAVPGPNGGYVVVRESV